MIWFRANSFLVRGALLGLACLLAPDGAFAQRPKIGLVLGGGGARGGAHVGVLEVLEELRIPIDYIAGTSIGSFVGGLYASGSSPAEMDSLVRTVDWIDLFKDSPARRYIPFRRKRDDRLDLFRVELGLGESGIKVPSGVVAGQKLNFLLRELTLNTIGTHDFDQLNIPFRAVATDLETGAPVILSDGDLADAMRASMAIPGFFTPVIRDGYLLVDGGVVLNLPIEVVREMGADIVIAVEVGEPPAELKDHPSLLGVAARTVSVLTYTKTQEQIETLTEADVLVRPNLSPVSTLSFDRVGQAEQLGRAYADSLRETLSRYSVSEDEYAQFLARQRKNPDHPLAGVRIDRVEVQGLNRASPKLIERRVHTKPGQPLSMRRLRRDLLRVYEVGEFERVDFQLDPAPPETVLKIDAHEKSWGPGYLRFGLRLEGNVDGNAAFMGLVYYRRAMMNRLGAEWLTLLTFGNVLSINTEFFQPLVYSGLWFIEPRLFAAEISSNTFIDTGSRISTTGTVWFGEFNTGFHFGSVAELRLSPLFGYTKSDIIDPENPQEAQLGQFLVSLTFDQLDSAAFPAHGGFVRSQLVLSRDGLGAADVYDRLVLDVSKPLTFGRNTLLLRGAYGSSLGSDLPSYDEFRLGGFGFLSGFVPGALRGDLLGFGALTGYRRIAELNDFVGQGVYLGGSIEFGNVWDDPSKARLDDTEVAVALFAGFDTNLGPLYLGYGNGWRGSSSFYVVLGHIYRNVIIR